MNNNKWLTLPIVAMLAACGGGGSDGKTVSPPDFSIEKASVITSAEIDLATVDINKLVSSLRKVLHAAYLDWPALGEREMLNFNFTKPSIPIGCEEKSNSGNFKAVACDGFTYELYEQDEVNGFSQQFRYKSDFRYGVRTVESRESLYQGLDDTILEFDETISSYNEDVEGDISDHYTSSIVIQVNKDKFIGQDFDFRNFMPLNLWSANGYIQSISGSVSYAGNEYSEIALVGSYAFTTVERSEFAQNIHPATPVMYKISSQGQSICIYAEHEDDWRDTSTELNIQLDRNCDGIADNKEHKFTLEKLPEYQADYITLAEVDAMDLARVIDWRLGSSIIDWGYLSRTQMISWKVTDLICKTDAEPWDFSRVVCGSSESSISEWASKRINDGLERELRQIVSTSTNIQKYTEHNIVKVSRQFDYRIKASAEYTKDDEITRKVFSNLLFSMPASELYRASSNHRIGYDYDSMPAANYLNKVKYSIDISGVVRVARFSGVNFTGAFDLQSIPRNSLARAQQPGSEVMYKVTSKEDSICLFAGPGVYDLSYHLIVDEDCDGIVE